MWIYITSLATTALALLELSKNWREYKGNLRRVVVLCLIVLMGIGSGLGTYFQNAAAERQHREDQAQIAKLQSSVDTSNAKLDQIILLLQGHVVQTTPSGPLSVSLSWQASATGGVVGYYVYRSLSPGGPKFRLNNSPIATTSYGDQNVKPGSTYYYVVTAVDARGMESASSNQISKSVPSTGSTTSGSLTPAISAPTC